MGTLLLHRAAESNEAGNHKPKVENIGNTMLLCNFWLSASFDSAALSPRFWGVHRKTARITYQALFDQFSHEIRQLFARPTHARMLSFGAQSVFVSNRCTYGAH